MLCTIYQPCMIPSSTELDPRVCNLGKDKGQLSRMVPLSQDSELSYICEDPFSNKVISIGSGDQDVNIFGRPLFYHHATNNLYPIKHGCHARISGWLSEFGPLQTHPPHPPLSLPPDSTPPFPKATLISCSQPSVCTFVLTVPKWPTHSSPRLISLSYPLHTSFRKLLTSALSVPLTDQAFTQWGELPFLFRQFQDIMYVYILLRLLV